MFASLKSDVRYKEGMAITKHGKTVARLAPVEAKALPLLGRMKGSLEISLGPLRSAGKPMSSAPLLLDRISGSAFRLAHTLDRP